MYVYKRTEFSPYCLYTVGYYDPDGKWQPESDHETSEAAAERTAWLNGSSLHSDNPYLLTGDELERTVNQRKRGY